METEHYHASATVTAIPERYANRVHTRITPFIGTAIGLLPLVFMVAGFCLMAYGLSFAFPPDGNQATGLQLVVSIALTTVGSALALGLAILGIRRPQWAAQTFFDGILKRSFELRPGALVRWRDPDVQLVDIIPRKNWRVMLQNDTDCGLLVVDERERELRFEGDIERYRIPGAAIEESRVESWSSGQFTYHYVVNRIWRDGEIWELVLNPSNGPSGLAAVANKAVAAALCQRICRIAEKATTD